MKNKKLLYLLCTLALALSMSACSGAKEKETQKNDTTTNTDVKNETGKKDEQAASKNPADSCYTPSDEIKNASISSGLIQVGNIVMKQGGYTTVADFITTYGENLDTSFYEKKVNDYNTWWERDSDEKFSHVLNLPIKDTDITLAVSYVSPKTITPDKKTIWDSVIVDVSASSDSGKDCKWYPGGITSKEFASLDEAKAWFSGNGFTENTDYVYERNTYMFLDVKNQKANLNQYATLKVSDTLSYVVAIIEVDEVNLFGEKPVMSYFVFDSNSDVFMTYGNTMYLNSQNSWKSEIR